MPFSDSNTGRTDLRLTEVQQPNTAATFSFSSSSRAFSANSGQLEAGSTTTASTLRPSRPPFLLMSSTIIRTVSFRVVSLIAIVPDSECRTPTLIGSAAWAVLPTNPVTDSAYTSAAALSLPPRATMKPALSILIIYRSAYRRKFGAKPFRTGRRGRSRMRRYSGA
jgi:hypothetical protein